MSTKFKTYGADFLLVLVAIVWGTSFLPVQKAVDEEPVYLFLFYRFAFACILMAILSIKHFKFLDKNALKGGVVLGTFLFLGFATQTFALQHSYSSTVAFITGLNVVIVPLFVYIFFRHKPSMFSNVGAVVASIGLYFLSKNQTFGFGVGELYALICAFMFAGQIALTDYFVKRCDVHVLVVVEFFTVSVLSVVASILYDGVILPKAWSETLLFALFITAVFATVFAFFVQSAMQKFTTPAKTAIIFTLEPVSAGIAGYFIANEMLTSWQIFGGLLILCGVLVAELGTHFKKGANAK